MSPSARKSVPTKELLRQVATQATGRLIAMVDPDPIEIFLMGGHIVGAVTASDERRLLEQAALRGLIPPKRVGELNVVLQGHNSIFGPLLDEIPADQVDPLLLDRFLENLARFVSTEHAPSFEAMPGVFVDNMQMGHAVADLIETAGRTADRVQRLNLDTELSASKAGVSWAAHSGATPTERSLLNAAGTPLSISDLIESVGGEPWQVRSTICELIDEGRLIEPEADLAPLAPVADEADEEEDDAPTIQVENLLAAAELTADLTSTLSDDDARQPKEEEVPEEVDEEEEEVDEEEEEVDEEEVDEEEQGQEVDEEEQEVDEEEQEDEQHRSTEPVVPINPGDMSMWLDTGDAVSEEDLAFFEDHEDDRGAGQGGFSTESHNLDKVEVGAAPDDEEVIEAAEATTGKFGAPVLSDSEAMDKLEVLNDVLRRVSAAFDASGGAGRGPAAIQLLVDGSPAKHAAILHDLEVDEDGEIDHEDVRGNVAGRPLSEQRLSLNAALKNLIERALSTAADELEDEAFDDLYESVAGYNTRLGL